MAARTGPELDATDLGFMQRASIDTKEERERLKRIARTLNVRNVDKTNSTQLLKKARAALDTASAAPVERERSARAGARDRPGSVQASKKKRSVAVVVDGKAAAPAAPGGALTRMPAVLLGQVVSLLGDLELAQMRGAGATVQSALAARLDAEADHCRKATGCGARCAELLEAAAPWGRLNGRCRRGCWQALGLRIARGIALWGDARPVVPEGHVDTQSALAAIPDFTAFGAFAPATADIKRASGPAGVWSLEVAWTQRKLYLHFPAAGTFRDLVELSNGGAVRAAVQRAQLQLQLHGHTLYSRSDPTDAQEQAIARAAEQEPQSPMDAEDGDVAAHIDFLVEGYAAPRGIAGLALRTDPNRYFRLGCTAAVRAAVLDAYMNVLRASAAPAAHNTRELIAELRRLLPSFPGSAASIGVPGSAASIGVPGRPDGLLSYPGNGRALYPHFRLLDAPPGQLPLERPLELLLVVDLTRSFAVGPTQVEVVWPATVAALLSLLDDRGLLAPEPVRRWLRLGALDFPTGGAIGADGPSYKVASADAPPTLPLPGCAEATALHAAAYSSAAAEAYAALPHNRRYYKASVEGDLRLLNARRHAERKSYPVHA